MYKMVDETMIDDGLIEENDSSTIEDKTDDNANVNKKKFTGKGLMIDNLFKSKWIIKHLPFAMFCAALAVIYVANGHWTDKTIRNINKAQKTLKQYRFEYKSAKSALMLATKESELAKAVAPLGLKRLTSPCLKLQLDTLNDEE